MGDTPNFIEIWLNLMDNNYDARRVAYATDMKDVLKQIPTTMTKPLSPRQKVQKLMTWICGGWYMEKVTKGLPPPRRTKLSKNHKRRSMRFKNYMRLIGIGMIGNYNYIDIILNGSIQKVKSKGKNLFSFFNFFT